MKNSWRRTLLLVVVLLLAWGSWYGWQSWKTSQALNALANVVRSADLDELLSDPPDVVKNSVDLAVRGIQLSQGSQGSKSFDLDADWATLNQESGSITVRDPEIRYFLRSEGGEKQREIHAVSLLGRVENGNQHISMEDDVRVTYEKSLLTGKLAVFLNEDRTLTFPEGAVLEGPALSGHTAVLQWDLDSNTLTGTGGVRMHWVPSARAQSGTGDTIPAKNDVEKESVSPSR